MSFDSKLKLKGVDQWNNLILLLLFIQRLPKLGNDFLHVLRLPADGKGFVVWKEWLELSIRARGLYGHLDGTVVKPYKPNTKLDTSPVGPEGAGPPTEGPKQLTAEQVGLIKKYTKELNHIRKNLNWEFSAILVQFSGI